MGWPAVSCCAVAVLAKGRAMLMPSTPSAYPQVISRHLASFRVVQFYVSAAHDHFWGGFDSRQLHQKGRRSGSCRGPARIGGGSRRGRRCATSEVGGAIAAATIQVEHVMPQK